MARHSAQPDRHNPVPVRTAEPVIADNRPYTEFSWVGKWADCGWSIRISPRLAEGQWRVFSPHADRAWDSEAFRYDPTKTMEVLHELFPTHQLQLTWPRCTHRTRNARPGHTPLYVACGAMAQYTELRAEDVNGVRVSIPRCADHRGQL